LPCLFRPTVQVIEKDDFVQQAVLRNRGQNLRSKLSLFAIPRLRKAAQTLAARRGVQWTKAKQLKIMYTLTELTEKEEQTTSLKNGQDPRSRIRRGK